MSGKHRNGGGPTAGGPREQAPRGRRVNFGFFGPESFPHRFPPQAQMHLQQPMMQHPSMHSPRMQQHLMHSPQMHEFQFPPHPSWLQNRNHHPRGPHYQQWHPHQMQQQQMHHQQMQQHHIQHQLMQHQHMQQQHQQQRHHQQKHQKQHQRKFEPYWSPADAKAAVEKGDLVEGFIRVNPKNYEDAFVPDRSSKHQVHINFLDRNRALNGDRVCVRINEKKEWIAQMDLIRDKLAKSPDDFHPFLLKQLKTILDDSDDVEEDVDVIVESEESSASGVESSSSFTSSSAASDCVFKEETPSNASTHAVVPDAADGVDADVKASTVPTPTLCQVREQLPPEIRSLVDQMEKSWKDGLKDEPTAAGGVGNKKVDGNSSSNNNKATSRRRKNTSRSDSATTKSLSILFKDFLGTEAGKTLVNDFPDDLLQKTGKVVLITQMVHTRKACGILKPLADGNPNMVLFSPNDHRLPRMLIPITDCPKDFRQRPNDYAKTLFIAEIAEWKETSMMAHGNIVKSLGDAGDIEPEHEGLLIEHGFDSSDFKDDVIACLPQVDSNTGFLIPQDECEKRKKSGFDYRHSCVFTIDPATARDLDDALHCEDLGDGIFEIGVHIADVSYFVEKGNALDQVASERATSVYCVHRMIPMLPRLLCEQLCSLQPATDRLSFSVVWRITEEGDIIDEKFGSSIIRSCAKLAYEHAQGFLDEPSRTWKEEELPDISGGWKVEDLVERVVNLQKVARNLRAKRFQNGALRLDQVKLSFTLHPETRMPVGYSVYEHNDSHRLIEEFMLLANMAVAHRLNEVYPEKAMLRRHPPPQENLMESLERFCESLSVNVDISTSGSLQSSLQSLVSADAFAAARLQVLTSMFSRPMQLAEYFCAGSVEDSEDYHHYALNVPLYTHFTSPIRRYPDVLVHRMLRASLTSMPDSDEELGSVDDLTVSANRCNILKANAKKVSEASSEIFFGLYVKECGPIEETGMVMGMLDKCFDVFMMRSGVSKRVYLEKCGLKGWKLRKPREKPPYLQLLWPSNPTEKGKEGKEGEEEEEQQEASGGASSSDRGAAKDIPFPKDDSIKQNLHIFSLVRVRLQTDPGLPLKYNAILLHPLYSKLEYQDGDLEEC